MNSVNSKSGKYSGIQWLWSFGVLVFAGCSTSSTTTITPEEASILTFVLERLYPDMVRTFYMARGFKPDAANRYSTTCVYKSVLRNTATEGTMNVHLRDWSIVVNGKTRPYKIEPDWQKEWTEMSVSPSARIAFKWSQFQPVQTFGPGDWLQGMSNLDLEPDTRFDIHLVWTRNEKTYKGVLKNVECGPPEK